MWDASFHDELSYDHINGSVEGSIFQTYLDSTGHLKRWECIHRESLHTYHSNWIVQHEKLYLDHAECIIEGVGVFNMLSIMFPNQTGPIFAYWFTGDITINTKHVSTSCISELCIGRTEVSVQKGAIASVWEMKRRLLEKEKSEIECRQAWLTEPNGIKPILRKENAGRPWSQEEDKRLLAEHGSGINIRDMATAHSRSTGAINSRIKKLLS